MFRNMSYVKSRIDSYKIKDKLFGLISTFKTYKFHNKIVAGVSVGLSVLAVYVQYKSAFQDVQKEYNWLMGLLQEENEKRARKKMIGTDVAHGLAWSHYCGYLKYVAPDIDKTIKNSAWFKGLSTEKRKRVSMKLYELIPRNCNVALPGSDDKIQKEDSQIIITANRTGNKRDIKLQIYSIWDGTMKYYCLCDCPYVLKTINNVNDIQLAEIACPEDSFLPWKKHPTIQPFTVETKLVQLMRFYYASSLLLCLKNKFDDDLRKNVRLLLFNESVEKPSEVLLRAIKEDLTNDESKQKTHGSLMECRLLSTEERKDIFYEFDAFVTHPRWLSRNEEPAALNRETQISRALKDEKINILFEKDCLGKDWLEKMKFAATKCRWIVYLEKKNCNNKQFTSSQVVDSLKKVLESKKVQTVAIVNERNELHIDDNLRWVTCIPDNSNERIKTETLCKVIRGSEVKLKSYNDLYLKPGDAAVGLAWGYVVNYLTKVLPDMEDKVENIMKGNESQYVLKNKLFILVPKSGKTSDVLDLELYKSTESPSHEESRSYDFNVYRLYLDKDVFMPCQYAAPVDVIYKMKEDNLLNESQMQLEVKKFYTTVEKIMKILLPGKRDVCEFVYYDDTKIKVSDVLTETYLKGEFCCDKQSPW